jgi:citrate synthase
VSNGLEGVVAAETVLSHADGENGVVWVRGHPIEDLVAHHGYEGTIALLWDGFAGNGLTHAGITAQLGAGRALAFSRLDDWLPAANRRPPIEALRMALAALPETARPRRLRGPPVAIAPCGRAPASLAAARSTVVDAADFRAWSTAPRSSNGSSPLDNDHHRDRQWARYLDLHRAASSRLRASLAPAVVGAYGAASGPLHGGAPALALDMPTRSRRATSTMARSRWPPAVG